MKKIVFLFMTLILKFYTVSGTAVLPIDKPTCIRSDPAVFFSKGIYPETALCSSQLLPPLCGSYNVGTGQTYATITSAMADLNSRGISCPVTFFLTDNSYPSETFPITIGTITGTTCLNTVTIKPAAGKSPVITGSSSTSILLLNGCKFFIINGSNCGGADQNLVWENTASTNNSSVIEFAVGGSIPGNIAIKNCLIRSTSQVSVNTYGIFMDNFQGGYDSIMISDNTINSARIGILFQGSPGAHATNGQIRNNIIGSVMDSHAILYRGVVLTNANNMLICGNEVMGAPSGNVNTAQAGIWVVAGASGTRILQNRIHDWYYTETGGYGNYGIYIGVGAASNTEISNNSISSIKADGSSASQDGITAGIYINGGGNINLFHNSVWLTGPVLQPANNGRSACLSIYSGITGLNIRNNIFKNSQTMVSGTSGTTYAIYCASPNTAFSYINYNDYFTDGINPNIGFLGTNQPTFPSWQTATGQDVYSKSLDPLFTASNDLHPGANGLAKSGIYLTTIPFDLAGTWRTNPPDIGAYQFSANPTAYTVQATLIMSNSAELNGIIYASYATVTTGFEYGLTAGYGNVVGSVPVYISGNNATNTTTSIGGLTPCTVYHYRTRGTSGGVTVYGQDITFLTTNTSNISFYVTTNNATYITNTTATLNGTIDPNGYTVAVSFEYGVTTAYGTTVPGQPDTIAGVSSLSITNITGLLPGTLYHFRVNGITNCGPKSGADNTFTTGCQQAGPAGIISGPANVCKGGTGKMYSVVPIPNATGYNWTVPNGSVIVAGANTTTVMVDYSANAVSGNVTVCGTSSCGNGLPSQLPVTVYSNPAPTITGPDSACQFSYWNTYSTQPGMSGYTWMISAGGIITSGAGTSTIHVNWFLAGAQSISVNYMNPGGCTALTPAVFNVSVQPDPLPAITGSTSLCVNSGYYNYNTEAGMSNYLWTLTSGGTIVSGQGTSQIIVTWNSAGAQTVIASYTNSIGCTSIFPGMLSVMVDPLPGAAGNVTGTGIVCAGTPGVAYWIPSVTNGSAYVWILPPGALIVNGMTTNSITVDFTSNASSGNIAVYANNLCGNGPVSPDYLVTVYPVPMTPVASLSFDTLISSSPEGNQWYFEGTVIPGATGQTCVATQNGFYWTSVTILGCTSDTSNHIHFTLVGNRAMGSISPLEVFPNPNDGKFSLSIPPDRHGFVEILIINNLGLRVAEFDAMHLNGSMKLLMDLGPVPDGTYALLFRNDDKILTAKVVVRK